MNNSSAQFHLERIPHKSHVSLNTAEINNSRQFLVCYAQGYWHILQGHCFNIQCIWQYDFRCSFLSPAFASPLCLCHSSFPFSSTYSIWAVFPTTSRDWDCLKGKSGKYGREREKLLQHGWRRGCRGVRMSVRHGEWGEVWGPLAGVVTQPFFVVKPSVFVVVCYTAPLVLILILLPIAETSPTPRPLFLVSFEDVP